MRWSGKHGQGVYLICSMTLRGLGSERTPTNCSLDKQINREQSSTTRTLEDTERGEEEARGRGKVISGQVRVENDNTWCVGSLSLVCEWSVSEKMEFGAQQEAMSTWAPGAVALAEQRGLKIVFAWNVLFKTHFWCVQKNSHWGPRSHYFKIAMKGAQLRLLVVEWNQQGCVKSMQSLAGIRLRNNCCELNTGYTRADLANLFQWNTFSFTNDSKME